MEIQKAGLHFAAQAALALHDVAQEPILNRLQQKVSLAVPGFVQQIEQRCAGLVAERQVGGEHLQVVRVLNDNGSGEDSE